MDLVIQRLEIRDWTTLSLKYKFGVIFKLQECINEQRESSIRIF